MRTLAIGDVHGCSAILRDLIAAVAPTSDDTLVFLGDYVDRGPDSRGVIDFILELKQSLNVVALRGNHEIMMLNARDADSDARMWLQVGGQNTLDSYAQPGRAGTLHDVPETHWHFLENDLQPYFETPTHLFAHAGLNPAEPLHEQSDLWLYWEFLEWPIAWPDGRTLVVGHTRQKSGKILDLGSTICIDTFAQGGGMLTCLHAETGHFWQANILGRVSEGDLPAR
jgi:serine/threonine protein phosphatase 1